jgi:hypothetical protein
VSGDLLMIVRKFKLRAFLVMLANELFIRSCFLGEIEMEQMNYYDSEY